MKHETVHTNEGYEGVTENFYDNILDLEEKFAGANVYGQPADQFIRRCLAGSYCMSTLGAALWLAKQQNWVNSRTSIDNPYADLYEDQVEAIQDAIKRPEMRYEDALPKAQFFFHRLPQAQRPVLGDLCQMVEEGRVDDRQLAFEKKWNDLDPEAARKKLTERNASTNRRYQSDIKQAARAILREPAPSSREPHFTALDWFYILGKVRDYMVGKEADKGMLNALKRDNRLRNPNLITEVEGDILQVQSVLAYVDQQLDHYEGVVETMSGDKAVADVSADDDNYVPLDGSHAEMH